jgi:hypothetical protein
MSPRHGIASIRANPAVRVGAVKVERPERSEDERP